MNEWQYKAELMNKKGLHCYTRRTALMQPSFSGLLVTWAYLPQTILPVVVTRPNSLTLTYGESAGRR